MARLKKPDINSNKFEMLQVIEDLRYSLMQYETLLGVKPFTKEDFCRYCSENGGGIPGFENYTFSIRDGHLILTYPDGTDVPNFYINSNGHLIYVE